MLEGVAAVRRLLQPGAIVDDWLASEADAIGSTAQLLASLGTQVFHEHSAGLYGLPTRPMRFDPTTPLALAEQVHAAIAELSATKLLQPAERDQSAEDVVAVLGPAVRRHFGADAPRIEIADELSSNALASTSRIKLRRDACFTRKDAAQLLNHEAFIHVATGLNGQAQPDLPHLALGHPGTTRTQEGLAVLSEFVSGTLELDRLRRLADRVVAVQMACEGADFLQVYRWFLERSASEDQAFESTRRIFRGAPLSGGAAFTKDSGYLAGLLAVATFVRAAFAAERSDALGLLFVGKLDLGAVPALAELRVAGLCRPARFLPPWALDPGWLLSYLTLNTFMGARRPERHQARGARRARPLPAPARALGPRSARPGVSRRYRARCVPTARLPNGARQPNTMRCTSGGGLASSNSSRYSVRIAAASARPGRARPAMARFMSKKNSAVRRAGRVSQVASAGTSPGLCARWNVPFGTSMASPARTRRSCPSSRNSSSPSRMMKRSSWRGCRW